jgi:phosphoribosylformylglycinamidine synthase
MAQSHFSLTGAATAIGEQPLKGLINPAAMARLCLGEALTNLVWAQSTGLADIKASVNWMYAAKMASEGVAMYEAATALKEAMVELQVLALIPLSLPGLFLWFWGTWFCWTWGSAGC